MRLARCLLLGSVLMIGVSATESAFAATEWIIEDVSKKSASPQLDVSAILGLFAGYTHVGVAGWYGYPLLPEGFIPEINDSFYIDAGAAIEHYADSVVVCDFSWWRITPMGGGRWNFHLTPDWTVFGQAKLGVGVGFGDSVTCDHQTEAAEPNYSGFVLDVGIGAYWRLDSSWSLRFDLGYFGAAVGGSMKL